MQILQGNYLDKLEKAFMHLQLSEDQEQELMHLAQDNVEQFLKLQEKGHVLEVKLNEVIKKLHDLFL